MPFDVQWDDVVKSQSGVLEQSFHLMQSEWEVPATLWLPTSHQPPFPLALLGHGGSSHRRSNRNIALAHFFASSAGIATVAIDGPFHGGRVQQRLAPLEYQSRIKDMGIDAVVDRMVGDWLATIGCLESIGQVDVRNLGYLGLSMGTRFGVPACAALGEDLRCAVLGKFGIQEAEGFYEGLDMSDRVRSDAPTITAPTLFHVQWDDEIFPKQGQFELFESLGSSDKLLIAFPGPSRPDGFDGGETLVHLPD